MPLALKPQKRTSEIDFAAVEAIKDSLGCDMLFAQILYNRGFSDEEACREFLLADKKDFNDPFSMLNMDRLVEQLNAADHITVYGDYDVDGLCAVTILYTALKQLGKDVSYYIPDRHSEGYGLNEQATSKIFSSGCELLVTVDCGITSNELISKFVAEGKNIIVTDHHSISSSVPECMVVKPGQPGDDYACTELCGAGIAFKVAQALLGDKADALVDFACVASIADVVPLTGENRLIVKKGLELFAKNIRPCFKALLDAAGSDKKIDSHTIAFAVAPRLNAAGRMASPYDALDLLLADSELEQKAQHLCELNNERQETEKRILDAAHAEISRLGLIRKYKVLVLGGVGWDDGVIGICAARLAEEYHRPCLLFTLENGMAKGSGRSIDGIDLFEMLTQVKDILQKFGGHKMAAGMSLESDKLPELTERLDAFLRENYDLRLLYPSALYDAKAHTDEITLQFLHNAEMLEPFGCGNREITLRVDNCFVGSLKQIGANKNHLRMCLQDDRGKLDAVAFFYENHMCDYFNIERCSCIVKPEINVWQNNESVSLKISDVKETENIKPRRNAEQLTASFYSRLALPKTGNADIAYVDDPEELAYMISEWDNEDIAGTLILCDHPEYAAGCISVLENEAPRFDVSYSVPLDKLNGYNSLVIGADIDKIDFSPFKRVVFYDILNTGYADAVSEKAPWLEMHALKCDLSLFDTLFEEYKQFERDDMMRAYRAISQSVGAYSGRAEFIDALSLKQISKPLASVAFDVFLELGFFELNEPFTVKLNKDVQKRTLGESEFYAKILKCLKK